MKYLIFCLAILVSTNGLAQNILNATSPEYLRKQREEKFKAVKTKKNDGDSLVSTKVDPLAYGFIEDNDVLWSKVTWEIIDLNEKLNQPFYHSSDGLVSSNKSLYEAIFDGIFPGKIKQVYDDEFFKTKLNPEAIKARIQSVKYADGLVDIINEGRKPTKQDSLEYQDVHKTTTTEVKLVKVKGMWYLDRRLGEMRYRLLGVCPLGPDAASKGQNIEGGNDVIDLFWIWYPDAREVLTNYIVFNSRNSSSPINYDDMLNARRFNSLIYKSENGYGSGNITDYVPRDAKGQLEESNKIKNNILQQENYMWNY